MNMQVRCYLPRIEYGNVLSRLSSSFERYIVGCMSNFVGQGSMLALHIGFPQFIFGCHLRF